MNQSVTYHIPALLEQTVNALDIVHGGTYVDVTFGGGGHSRAILEHLVAEEGGHLYSFDQDRDAIANAFTGDPRFTMVLGNFRFITQFLRYYGVEPGSVDGVLADLGVSFHHFDDSQRGFSFRFDDAPLDMRMNQSSALTAEKVVNEYTEQRLAEILRLYGELKGSSRFAKRIVEARAKQPIATASALLDVVEPLINRRNATQEKAQLFQALRIEVNGELNALVQMLEGALKMLRPGGRLAIITYHSLEDRIVKNFMKTGNIDGRAQQDFYGRSLSPMRLLTSKPIVPDADEIERNPRSRSAKLRIAEKI